MNDEKYRLIHQIQEEVQIYPRMHGYYLIRIVSIFDKRQKHWDEESMINWAFCEMDDQQWSNVENVAQDQSWTQDYQTTKDIALEELASALIGGSNVGHSVHTIDPQKALVIANKFDSIFRSPKKYFHRMGFGDSSYVFQNGIGIADEDTVGIFFVVESD